MLSQDVFLVMGPSIIATNAQLREHGACSPSTAYLLYHTGYWLYFYMYNVV